MRLIRNFALNRIVQFVFIVTIFHQSTATPVDFDSLTENADIHHAALDEDIILELNQGLLRGMRHISRGGRNFLAFMSIPYAKPPVGDLRFQTTVEWESWEGTLNATTLSLQCIQKDKYNPDPSVAKGSEDCLYLNVYTPKTLQELNCTGNPELLPVLFYIHGGGPTGNASRYRGDYFMDEEVIFITLHYRLGIFGNLNLNDTTTRGNQGMKDQVMALRWVQDSIQKFGGDPKRVTIFGNSFGGMQVTTHLVSPMSKGLFHRAISQSGVNIFPGMLNENPHQTAIEFGKLVNCTLKNSTDLLGCLKNVDASVLAALSYDAPFTFSVEPVSENNGSDSILPDQPLWLFQNGNSHQIPTIIGVNSGESLGNALQILLTPNLTETINNFWIEFITEQLVLSLTASNPGAIAIAARSSYFNNTAVSRDTRDNLTNLFSDRTYTHPAATLASVLKDNVYLYYFDRKVGRKYTAVLEEMYGSDEFLGASHADELQLFFPYDDYPYVSLDSEYAFISQAMVKYWATFAANGKPSGIGTEWENIKSNQKPFQWLHLTDAPKMITLEKRMQFWDSYNLSDLYVTKTHL